MRGEPVHVRERLRAAVDGGEPVVVSAVAAQELVLGAHLSARAAHHLRLLGELLSAFSIEPFGWDDAIATGRLRAERERQGRRLPAYDVMIAGQALARGWTVVTANLRDFWEVQGLMIQDWSDPSGIAHFTGGWPPRSPSGG